MKKSLLLFLSLPVLVYGLSTFSYRQAPGRFHAPQELAFFKTHRIQPNAWTNAAKNAGRPPGWGRLLPIDSNILFPTSRTCNGCHGYDPNGFALVTTSGEDVNIYDDWRSTMMANAARDPFWRAKVTHEILVNPGHSLQLQDKCTSCHAPAGHYQSKLKYHQAYYTLSDLYADTLGLDGVTCQICHAQAPALIGSLHSGALNFDTNNIRVAYGPYDVPFAPPMHDFVGITPKYGDHLSDAGLCAGCHTLITETADLNGQPTGGTFVEQATYHEWLNSRYDDEHDNITCQGCHVPQLLDEIIISANYQFLTPKFPFGLHELAGANVPMLKILRDNRLKLGIPAEAVHFDSTIAATLRMLQGKTLDLTLTPGVLHGDTAFFDLKLLNKTGHKLPSGYPARRMWVEFVVENATGDTVFHSGRYQPDFSVPDEDAQVEPHYDVIYRADQVQIYELVPGDVTGAFTTVLERADKALKDNRLAPQGFQLSDPVYDTVRIVGQAQSDPDFNRFTGGSEGSGSDVLHFHIPVNNYTGALTVSAKVWYQSLPPKWMAPLFAVSTPEIDSFRVMFETADRSPVLLASAILENVLVSPVSTADQRLENGLRVTPALTPDGVLRIDLAAGLRVEQVMVWSAAGRLLAKTGDTLLRLPEGKGVYYIEVRTNHGRAVRRVLRTN